MPRLKTCSRKPLRRSASDGRCLALASSNTNHGTISMNDHKRLRAGAALALACGLVVAVAQPGRAQSVEEFYKGKTLNLIIGYSVGGGYHPYGRPPGPPTGKHIPGRPPDRPPKLTGPRRPPAGQSTPSVR